MHLTHILIKKGENARCGQKTQGQGDGRWDRGSWGQERGFGVVESRGGVGSRGVGVKEMGSGELGSQIVTPPFSTHSCSNRLSHFSQHFPEPPPPLFQHPFHTSPHTNTLSCTYYPSPTPPHTFLHPNTLPTHLPTPSLTVERDSAVSGY